MTYDKIRQKIKSIKSKVPDNTSIGEEMRNIILREASDGEEIIHTVEKTAHITPEKINLSSEKELFLTYLSKNGNA